MSNLTIKQENDSIFEQGSFQEMRSMVIKEARPVPVKRDNLYKLHEHIIRTDTISAVLKFPEERIVALNFANAKHPGGAYTLGGDAQEEALCRASLLYYTIRTAKEFYQINRRHFLADYTDTMIWSENVPIIRKNDGTRLETPSLCNFITCPAVNRRFAWPWFSNEKIEKIMQRRIVNIVALAVEKQPEVVIFGAFGCGAFGNKRETVYPIFEQAIRRFVPDHIEVYFADPR